MADWFLSRLAYRAIKSLLPRAYGVDKNFAPLLAQAARYGIIIFAIMTAASFLGVPNTSIIAILGAMGLAVALALQNTLSNIAAGIMLIWLRPISKGDEGGKAEATVATDPHASNQREAGGREPHDAQ